MTLIHITIRPDTTLDVDAAELESLTRQGLVVGVPAPTHHTAADPVVTYVSTTLEPDIPVGVGAAELESLTRQRLIAHDFGLIAHAGITTATGAAYTLVHPAPAGIAVGAAAANPPSITTSPNVPAPAATGSGTASSPTTRISVAAGATAGAGAAAGAATTARGFYSLWVTLTGSTTNLWAINHATGAAQVSVFAQLLES